MTSPLLAGGTDPVQAACFLLLRHARAEVWPQDRHGQLLVLRKARARVHPDRLAGDRTKWDELEVAARTLGLL